LERLEKELEKSHRAAHRQAAPFSKGEPKAEPKTPGRKAGGDYGEPSFRPVPFAESDGEALHFLPDDPIA